MPAESRPSSIRFVIVAVTTLVAFLMYLDRVCMAEIVKSESFKAEFGFSKEDMGKVQSAFFFAYALAQVPAGWLSDRFGARGLMAVYIALWSGFTVLTGFATGLTSLLLWRLGCGLTEAGAYPTSAGLLSRWIPLSIRGTASSIVSLGGRMGGAAAPALTLLVIAALGNWRWAGWIFGFTGIAVAALFWFVFRERPSEHPWCNEAERGLISAGVPASTAQAAEVKGIPLVALASNFSMWMNCVFQLLTNIGWAFLVTWLPTYLKEVQKVDDKTNVTMVGIVLMLGMAGMLTGGWFTDYTTRRFGVRRGRLIPMVTTRFMAAGAYLLSFLFKDPWLVVAAFALVSFTTDMGIPAVWAYNQDVGGRHVGTVLGWGNMWGNLGAAMTAGLLPWVNKTFDPAGTWHAALLVCAGSFAISGIVAFGINADDRIVKERAREG
jgi:ACS family glucarate transporter-like MFS transporter